jgi:hypothetical protein
MSTEDRLRDALHAEAARVEPHEGWTMIESRLSKAVPQNRNRYLMAGAAAALVLVAAVAVMAQQDDDTRPILTNPGPDATTTTTTPPAVTPTTAVTRTTAVALDLGPHRGILWSYSAATPRAIADLFARDFLGMPNPNVGQFQQGDNRSGEVVIHPKPTGTLATTVAVREFDGQWYVIAANADNLELDTPATNQPISSPVHLTGRSIAFEGHVNVAVLRYDTTMQCTLPTDSCGSNPGVYANTYFTGSGDEKTPFSTDVTFTKPSGEYGYVILSTYSAEDGTLSEATVRLIRFVS